MTSVVQKNTKSNRSFMRTVGRWKTGKWKSSPLWWASRRASGMAAVGWPLWTSLRDLSNQLDGYSSSEEFASPSKRNTQPSGKGLLSPPASDEVITQIHIVLDAAWYRFLRTVVSARRHSPLGRWHVEVSVGCLRVVGLPMKPRSVFCAR